MTEQDAPLLEAAIYADTWHKYETSFFSRTGTFTNIYFLGERPVVFVNGSVVMREGKKTLTLDLLFIDNDAKQQNAMVLIEGFKVMEHNARMAGFVSVTTSSNNPELAAFAVKEMGFTAGSADVTGEIPLRKELVLTIDCGSCGTTETREASHGL